MDYQEINLLDNDVSFCYLVPLECRCWISFNLNSDVANLICNIYTNTEWLCETDVLNTYTNLNVSTTHKTEIHIN